MLIRVDIVQWVRDYIQIKMKQLFAARNKLREYSHDKFAEYLENNKANLTSIDYINLLQESYHLYKKHFLDYLRIFHKYFHDIVFSELDNGKRKLTVLEEILKYRKAWELEELIKIDPRIIKDFNLYALNCAITNIYNQKDPKNGYELVQMLINKKPDIIIDPIYDDRNNPLIEAIRNEFYDIACLLLKSQCYLLPLKNYFSNQFHYLLSNRTSKKNHSKLIELSKLLIDRKVDIYQKNEHGKTPLDFSTNDFKQEILKIHKASRPTKTYPIHTNNIKNTDKYKNRQKNDIKTLNYDPNERNKGDKGNKDNSSQSHSISGGSNKNIFKGKVKSEFGGKEMIKENNELLRINIQSNNISYKESTCNIVCKESTSNLAASNMVKVVSFDELQNEASMVFQQHTKRKEEQFMNQRAEYEREAKQKKERQPRIIQSEELKYYLREEIVILTESIKEMNETQKPGYNKIFQQIKNRLESKINVITVDIFGSFATDLHLDLSDIDIVIIAKENLKDVDYKSQQRTIHEIFQTVCNELKQMTEFIEEANYLDKASIPIIKATCKKEYDFKNIDISFQDEQHKGIESVELIKQYLKVYPELNNLMLVLKKFIYESKLFSPYSGGLSSYGLFLMSVAFIQHEDLRNPIDRYHPQYDMHLRTAQLLIDFLKFYGFKMDYVTQKIVVTRPDNLNNITKPIVYNSEWQNEFPPQPKLIIMDPLYEQNNVGKATRRIKQIKMAFELAFIAIHTNKRCKGKKSCESYKVIKGVRMSQVRFRENKRPCCILERMFRCTETFNLHEY